MHFWIDKRSQACSLSGRYRAPSGVSSSRHRGGGVPLWGGAGAGGCKVGGLVMVTPVHRFQPIESAQAGCGLRRAHHQRHHQRLLSHQGASLLQSHTHSTSTRIPAEPSLDGNSYNGSTQNSDAVGRGGGGMSLLPQGSEPGLAPQQQVLLRLPAPRQEGLARAKMKCGLWTSVALMVSCFAAAKYYAGPKGTGLELFFPVVCGSVLMLYLASCVLSHCCAGSSRGCLAARTAQASNQNQDSAGPRSALIEVPEEEGASAAATDSLMLAQHTQPWIQQQQPPHQQSTTQLLHQAPQSSAGEPPPYHIAIWLPQPESPIHIIPPAHGSQEVPPPSYDKATS